MNHDHKLVKQKLKTVAANQDMQADFEMAANSENISNLKS